MSNTAHIKNRDACPRATRIYPPGLGEIEHGRDRGLRCLLGNFRRPPAGGERRFLGPARSRVFESALTLHVLRRANVEPEWQRRLRGFLTDHSADADAISRIIALAAMEIPVTEDAMTALSGLIDGLEYGLRRKRALLLMLLVELGVVPLSRTGVAPGDFAAGAVHRFSQLYEAALRLMYARHAGGVAEDRTRRDAAFIAACQGSSPIW